jgi:hypothetical protein
MCNVPLSILNHILVRFQCRGWGLGIAVPKSAPACPKTLLVFALGYADHAATLDKRPCGECWTQASLQNRPSGVGTGSGKIMRHGIFPR